MGRPVNVWDRLFRFCPTRFQTQRCSLLRDASLQATQGETLTMAHEAKEADMAFFDNADGEIIHTGLLLDNNRIIHASGQVRIDSFDHQGIFNKELNKYTYTLRLIKRIL